jgi:hypothetical protein
LRGGWPSQRVPREARPDDRLREAGWNAGFSRRGTPRISLRSSGLRPETADPIYAAIAAHARAYAAYDAPQKAEPDDEVTPEPLIEAEWVATEALAATVPTTLAGTAAALTYVHALHARDKYMLLDDWHAYVFIGSAATAMRNVLDRGERGVPNVFLYDGY